MHCVTTSMLELGKFSAIGQEFELVVFDDLEFQLTLQTNIPKPPKSPNSTTFSSISGSKPANKMSKLKNFLTSPKKRREQERRQREEEEQAAMEEQDGDDRREHHQLSQWDLQHELVGPDGSFARAYVSLKDFEKQAFGRPFVVDVPCYNEWAVEDKSITSSTRSKLGGIQRRPPYKIAKMELQMMYIPRPRGAKDEDMPRSMSAALRQLKEAQNASDVRFEGHLSQQGGDCPVSLAEVILHTDIRMTNTSTVLASSLLPSRRLQAHRLPRDNPPTPCLHQPRKSSQADQRPPRPHPIRASQTRQRPSQIRLRRRRRGLHVRRGGLPHPLCQWRSH